MKRSICCLAIVLAALGGLIVFVGDSPQPQQQPPSFRYPGYNLVFVSFDALQAAHVGSHGYFRNTTPTLDAFAANGFQFTQAHSVASWTVPASMTWFTGVYPSEHRVVNKFADVPAKKPTNLRALSPNLSTLAEVLKQNGYATGGFTGNAGVSGMFGYEQGFDTYYAPTATFGSFDGSIPKALAWVKANRERKFFLFLHGYDCHGQNTPATGYDGRFVDPNYDRKFSGTEIEHEVLREEGIERGRLTLRDADVRFWRAVYDEKIQRADEKFRKFLAEYEALGLMGNTIFVVTSDHGTEVYEHRRFDHGFTLYEETLHVPLVIRLPDHAGGRRIDDRIGSIDMMPTVLELLGATIPEKVTRQLRGRSLIPALRGERVSRDVFFETDYREHTFKRGVMSPDGMKFILTMEIKGRELYDLTSDPTESNNQAESKKDVADAMERRLFAHFRSIGHDLDERVWRPGFNPVYAFPEKRP